MSAPATPSRSPSELRTILIVDDDPDLRALIGRALSSAYRVVEATDGLHACELLGSMPVPALVICDVMMPRVDGFTLVRRMRADERLKSIPVLFLTARAAAADVVQGIGLGARHYMVKPFQVADLLARVARLVK